jgi:mycothiol synthase
MDDGTVAIRPFDYRGAGDELFAAYTAHANLIRAELPDDPPRSLRRVCALWLELPPFVKRWGWLAVTADEQLVGASMLTVEDTGDNRHLAYATADVAPPWRRQALARRLLAPLARCAQEEGRSLLLISTSDRAPAGVAFMGRVGALPGQTHSVSQLDLAQVDQARVQSWIDQAPPGFSLLFRSPPFPEKELPAVAALQTMMLNEAPHGQLDVGEFQVTAEEVRQEHRFYQQAGVDLWSLHALHLDSGELAGGTAVLVDPEQPAIVQQLGTGVYPQFRRQGLGRWLKAAMLQKLQGEWPQGRFVRTSNDTTNAAMLKINRELDFRPYSSQTIWQIPTAQDLGYTGG